MEDIKKSVRAKIVFLTDRMTELKTVDFSM